MKTNFFKFLGLSLAAVLVAALSFSCGSSSSSGGGSSTPKVALEFTPTSGTIGAVNLNSMFYMNIVPSTGAVDPSSIQISISPTVSFNTTLGFSSGAFDGYAFITPNGFLTAGTTYNVTTNFNVTVGSTSYTETVASSFTTISSSGTPSSVPGDSFIVTVTSVSQPPGLGTLLAGNIPTLAISIITATAATGTPANGAQGSMILYGGQANVNTSPTDIPSSSFTLPFAAIWNGNEFMSFGSATLSVSGITVPLQTFNLSGVVSSGSISDGVLYGVVHCTDASCTNLGTTVGPIVDQYIDNNGNMTVLGTFSGAPNTVPVTDWIDPSDTANLAFTAGTSAAALEVTPAATSPLQGTPTLPFMILTQTDANNMMSIVGVGLGTKLSGSGTPVYIGYALGTPTGAAFTPTSGQQFTAYTMFGLSASPTTGFAVSVP